MIRFTCAASAAALVVTLASCSRSPVTGHGTFAAPTSASPSKTPGTGSGTTPDSVSAPPQPSSTHAAPTWASVFRRVSSGVVRIDVENCYEAGTGSGFLIGPDLVATVAHVVEGMGSIRVTAPGLALATSARVIGLSHAHDLALLRTDVPLPGHVFTLGSRAPEIGTPMAAIGFSLGGGMQLSPGTVTGTHNHRDVGGGGTIYSLSDVVLTDAAVNPGNSGGPWLTPDGKVIALDESGPPYSSDGERAQGNNGGVSSIDAASHFSAWQSTPRYIPSGDCPTPPQSEQAALFTLATYFQDIDLSDYASAYAQHDDATPQGLASFVTGVETSEDNAIDGSGAPFGEDGTGVDDRGRYVDVTFESRQDPDHAPAGTRMRCTVWHIRYHFAETRGLTLIHSADAEPGRQLFEPC